MAVDGGMSDNLRPMLYGSRYEALIADRPLGRRRPSAASGRQALRVRRRDRPRRRAGRPARPATCSSTPATGAYGYALANNYNGVPRPPVLFCRDGNARVVVRRETYEDLMSRDVRRDARFRVGLLGHGTVGAAFAEQLPRHAERIERMTGLRPELSGVLTRSQRRLRGAPRRRRT